MRYYVSLINRAGNARQEAELGTHQIRSKLISQLTAMFELANRCSQVTIFLPSKKKTERRRLCKKIREISPAVNEVIYRF